MTDYTTILNSQVTKLDTIRDGDDFKVWQSHTLNILRRVFREDSSQWHQLSGISYRSGSDQRVILGGSRRRSYFDDPLPPKVIPATPDNLNYCISQSRSLLIAFTEELEILGPPSFKELPNNNGISIINNLNQNQSIQLSIVLNTLRDELTGKQYQEVNEILKSDLKPEDKKQTLLKKLSSFGSDVLSGVLSSLLTNPQVYQAFM